MKISDLLQVLEESRAPTSFTCLQAIQSVLGPQNVSTNLKTIEPHQFLVTTVDYDDEMKYIKKKDIIDRPQMFRGGQVRPSQLSTFTPRSSRQNNYYTNLPHAYPDYRPYSGTISIADPNSRDAFDVATAVHEAYHSWIFSRSRQGSVWGNEKMVNKATEKWLRKNLSGMALYTALEAINSSKIFYKDQSI